MVNILLEMIYYLQIYNMSTLILLPDYHPPFNSDDVCQYLYVVTN